MPTDTSERGLERLICTALAGHPCEPPTSGTVAEPPTGYGGVGWSGGNPHDYDREYCVDVVQLRVFLRATQPEAAGTLALDEDGPTRRRFLARLQGEVSKRGTIDVLRNGVRHGPHHLHLFYGTPSSGNEPARERFEHNRFSVTRQLRYSRDETQRALDIGLFINGLPVFTFELKNSLTKQTADDAVQQYRRDRNWRERLFEFGRCVTHFAVDDSEVRFCTRLQGKASWFLPFNRGWNDGAGNPPNPNGIKTDYLWRAVLSRGSLTDILENYAQVVASKDDKTGRNRKTQIWPRYHQLDVVRHLLADAGASGAGRRYLIQHSAGSGKSNSIAWLARQLIDLRKDDAAVFDSIIVVTDRRILDRQIHDTIRQFSQVSATVGHADRSGDLRRFIESGKKIIISTVQKFPFILDEIGNEQRGRRFAIIIDEAHSSQGGRTSGAMTQALAEAGQAEEEETFEDQINRLMESRRLLPNASYFAFTATPKNKTLEIFGDPEPQPNGAVKHHPFHSYTMKQAIQEGFILDVLQHYTPVQSYYKLAKTVEDDPEFDTKRAQKKLRRFVEGHDHAIRPKAEIMADHFHDQVLTQGKIGGQARAMVVTNGIERAIQYFHAVRDYLQERKSRYQAIVAFSGEFEFSGARVTEASLNGFSSNKIAEMIRQNPYRFLICADKFQTGYDEPLLHTMYVDKTLSGIKAVQTLSRLNRAHPQKHDAFVLDFLNDADTIRDAFTDFYRTTILADETDPDKPHDLQAALDGAQVYAPEQVDDFAKLYLGGADRDQLDPILDACVAVYLSDLDEDGQVAFKSNSIAWLARQLIDLRKDDAAVFDSIIVVTDRRILDRQIHDTIRQFSQVSATVGHADRSGDLRRFIESGKKIIISTVQKFPFILDEIGNEQRGRRFAIIIDEAHSSQGGRTSGAMTQALAEAGQAEEEETFEDQINRLMESRRLLPNASYFAFTATPKNKTLEIFGDPEPQPNGAVKHHPFHSYTMKQAIQEGFILDVLQHYTPVQSYYKLAKTVEDDPEFDTKRAQKKLRRFVEGHDHAIRPKAEIMADHFHDQVLTQGKIGGQARAMVVTNGIERAIQYFHAVRDYLQERKSRYQAIVAFSGEFEFSGARVTEASLNGFSSNKIAEMIRQNPYRFLICADKFQTGYDEPLLHTMYVDKTLSGIKAVQTLSRLNRAHPQKHDAFVLDFLNDADTIRDAFTDFYRTTILADETDPDKPHDLQAALDGAQVYAPEQVDDFAKLYLGGADRDQLDPILDACVAVYLSDLDEDGQVAFKGSAKGFVRTYAFLSSVLPYTHAAWEKRSILLNFLIPKLPAPQEADLSKGILDAIDMDSYRVEKQALQKIMLLDEDAEIDPVPTSGGGHRPEPELDRLSNILRSFNEHFGDISWDDADRVHRLITETIPSRVAEDSAFRNAQRNSDRENARIEHDKALLRVMTSLMKDDTELFKQFIDNASFKRWLTDTVFALAYDRAGAA